ncbi:MAG: hypothetical protein MRERV_39c021 [Mycoplasmataceae bacterium RV_VA103A]|nr:MAG: hypothetical protein MRERV_39c021 [Mycoplasmataceae bacterium RV_VA103A]
MVESKNNTSQRLTDKEIEHYHSLITIKSIFDDKKGGFSWMVCCKKCGGPLFPYNKAMEKKHVDNALKEHECIEINKNGRN